MMITRMSISLPEPPNCANGGGLQAFSIRRQIVILFRLELRVKIAVAMSGGVDSSAAAAL